MLSPEFPVPGILSCTRLFGGRLYPIKCRPVLYTASHLAAGCAHYPAEEEELRLATSCYDTYKVRMSETLFPIPPVHQNTEHRFKELYYYLYSNSSSSRSERILADLSKLILLSIGGDGDAIAMARERFLGGAGSANSILLPALAIKYPDATVADDTFSLGDEAVAHCLRTLSEINLSDSPSHTFGDAFQALMGPRLRGDKGQFFTPRSVVRAMVDIANPSNDAKVIDPACGTGGFLSAVLDFWAARSLTGKAIGIEKDSDLALLASALSTVHAASGEVSVKCANSLSIPGLEKIGIALGSFDMVLTNPPFGAKIGITDHTILKEYELGHVWDKPIKGKGWTKGALVRSSQDPQVLFVELCVRLLREGGKLGIVLPEGMFGNTGSGYVWDYLRHNGTIDALIDCPRTTFQPGTDTKTNILFFTKGTAATLREECKIAVAYTCGHDKRGRSVKANGDLVEDDFAKIARQWNAKPDECHVWSAAEITDRYYLVPRYYDKRLADDVEKDAARLNSPVVSLSELINSGQISIRKGHEVGSEAYGTGDIPFIRTSDIHNFEVSHDPTNCVSEDIYDRFRSQQRLKSGDILMVVDGRYKIGRCAILHDWTTMAVIQSHLRIISTSISSKFSPMALLYSLSLPSVQREIRRLVFIQSTLGSLGSRINEIRLPDPRHSKAWGECVERFSEAIITRSQSGRFLQSFGAEFEL